MTRQTPAEIAAQRKREAAQAREEKLARQQLRKVPVARQKRVFFELTEALVAANREGKRKMLLRPDRTGSESSEREQARNELIERLRAEKEARIGKKYHLTRAQLDCISSDGMEGSWPVAPGTERLVN